MKKYLSLENLAILIVFALPSYLLRMDVFGIRTNALECLILVFLAAFFLSARNREKTGAFLLENRMLFLFAGLMLIGLLIATIGNPDLCGNIGIVKGWFVLPFAFVLAARTILGKGGYGNLFRSLYWSAFLVSMISLGYFFSGKLTYDGRLEAVFNSPNYLAMYLSPAIIIGFFMLKDAFSKSDSEDGFLWKALSAVSFSVIALVAYLTFSYASWAALAVSLMLLVLSKKRNAKRWLIVGMIIIVGVIASQASTGKFKSLATLDPRSSLASRTMIWKAAFRILDDEWLIGIGPAGFQSRYLAYQKYFPPYLEWAVPHPHNLFLFIWLSSGIVGIVGFLGVIFFWAKKAISSFRKNRTIAIPIAIMIYILLVSLLDTYMKNDLAVIFWLAVFSI